MSFIGNHHLQTSVNPIATLIGLLGLLAVVPFNAGCVTLKAVTSSRVYSENPAIKDVTPVVEMPVSGSGGNKIALIDVDGLMLNQNMLGLSSYGENPVAIFREKLDRVARDPCYCALVLRINSPGGSVTATDIMWKDLMDFKQQTKMPVIACLMDVGAGGAYYLATAADQIVAHPTTITGGIGVILNVYNLADAMQTYNIASTPIKAGRFADVGSPERPMTQGSRRILLDAAESFHERFIQIVMNSRGVTETDENHLFDGRIFIGPEAQKLGLVDSIGYLDDAIAMARSVSGKPSATTVILHRSKDKARTPYDITPNVPVGKGDVVPSFPGLSRSRMPAFLYIWQPDPALMP